jgi:uncharacterized hydrophobic protein (TIGR00271 family)
MITVHRPHGELVASIIVRGPAVASSRKPWRKTGVTTRLRRTANASQPAAAAAARTTATCWVRRAPGCSFQMRRSVALPPSVAMVQTLNGRASGGHIHRMGRNPRLGYRSAETFIRCGGCGGAGSRSAMQATRSLFHLRAYLPVERVPEIIGALAGVGGVRHVVRTGASAAGSIELVTAEVESRSADLVFETLDQLGVPPTEVSLGQEIRASPVGATTGRWLGTGDVMVWADVIQTARHNARVFARYLVFMAIAGVIAGFGVMNKSSILIVGAMAVSPDLFPMSAVCVGVVARRGRLAGRALVTLVVGLALTGVVAWAVTASMQAIGYPPLRGALGDGGLGVLPTVNASTFIIAFVAGVAGILALESRASAAVGVAISITTIPAVSYAGVALMVGDTHAALVALAVLGINVVMVLVAGTLTLAVQRSMRPERHS